MNAIAPPPSVSTLCSRFFSPVRTTVSFCSWREIRRHWKETCAVERNLEKETWTEKKPGHPLSKGSESTSSSRYSVELVLCLLIVANVPGVLRPSGSVKRLPSIGDIPCQPATARVCSHFGARRALGLQIIQIPPCSSLHGLCQSIAMPYSRAHIVDNTNGGDYHCISRCVRRCWLCGFDDFTQRSYEHRREWIETRLVHLAEQFALDLLS